jgi:hypothetical protein
MSANFSLFCCCNVMLFADGVPMFSSYYSSAFMKSTLTLDALTGRAYDKQANYYLYALDTISLLPASRHYRNRH